jgi:hypothetical protein
MKNIFYKKILFLLLSFIIVSCYEDITENPIPNQPPETGLSLFPDSTISGQPSRLNVSWWGDDPDGLIIGYYFSWDGVNWSFTSSNDSLFALEIGVVDTIYTFRISAADQDGNGRYDNQVVQNNINYGPEPFIDANNNGLYDNGEFFYDVGLIDPTPAELNFPIKNSAPVINWNTLSFLPDTSFPVMSFGWDVEDIDGNETIQQINIALNDTTNFVSINGSIRIVTIRTDEFESANPLMEILIEGNPNNISSEKLPGLKFDDANVFYVQAVDFSGAKSPFIRLPAENETWFVKKPIGELLIIDDYTSFDDAAGFYYKMMDSLGLSGSYNVYDLNTHKPPYINITFLETIKLFKYALWYSDNNPSLDIAVASIQKYLDAGSKLLFTTQFPQNVDLGNIKGFLPIITDSSDYLSSILAGTVVSADSTQPEYPAHQVTSSLFRVRSFYLEISALPIYYFANGELNGYIGFMNSATLRNLFFIGLPLHKINGGNANVKSLLEKVLFQDFGLVP